MTTVPTTSLQRQALLEGRVWRTLRHARDGSVYSASGPGWISTAEQVERLVLRGWFTKTDTEYEITAEGIAAADNIEDGDLASW